MLCCTATDYKTVVGFGIKCRVLPPRELCPRPTELDHSANFVAGNKAFLISNGCELDRFTEDQQGESLESLEKKYESRGYTLTYISINSQLRALFAISDTPKPEAAATVEYLKNRGIKVCMITGDQESAAKLIAHEIGIGEIYYGSTPSGKHSLISRFKKNGEIVAMVGDGVNDSASLASADLGIAVNTASGMSMEASDVVLVRQDLTGVIVAMDLSGKILKRIKVNFAWAFIYNLLMIPLAAGIGTPFNITLHAMAAGFAMSMSSLSVVLSSLCLNFYSPPKTLNSYLPLCPNSPSNMHTTASGATQDRPPWAHLVENFAPGRKHSGAFRLNNRGFERCLEWCLPATEYCRMLLRKLLRRHSTHTYTINTQSPTKKKFKDIMLVHTAAADSAIPTGKIEI